MVTGYIALTGKLQEVLLKLPAEVMVSDVDIELPGAHHMLGEIFKTGKPITAKFIIQVEDGTVDIIANGSIINAFNGTVYSMNFCVSFVDAVLFFTISTDIETPDKIFVSTKRTTSST